MIQMQTSLTVADNSGAKRVVMIMPIGGSTGKIARLGDKIKVTVKGGYSPDVIVVKSGVPVRLNFYRDETSSCSEQVVFGDFGIVKNLPPYQTTPIEFTPEKSGEFIFACGMNMMKGKILVQ